MSDDPRHYVARPASRFFTIGWVLVVLVVGVATGALVLARELRVRRQGEQLDRDLGAGRRVLVTEPQQAPPTRSLEVPATVRGFSESPVYAKVSGYVKSLAVDKGDRVTEGQVLATLEAPELDHQVANARAAYELQQVTDRRTQALVKTGVIARQMGDETHAALRQAEATLQQLQATQEYEVIRAPFAGVVTARAIDPGTLVTPGTSSSGTAILTLASLGTVRVAANVPQSAAPHVQVGNPARITVVEYPGRVFTGGVSRRSDALEPATRTMLVEIDVPNEDGALYPGMYAKASFTVSLPAGPPTVPDDALVFRGGKVFVPVVRDQKLTLAEVVLGYDDGRRVEITSGLDADDAIALNVGQAARDGEVVQPVPAETHP